MGFLEELAGTLEKHPATNGQQHKSLVQEIWGRFGNSSEIKKLEDTARSKGLGDVVDSWIKQGQNKPVNADQAKGLVGEGWVKAIANRTGIPESVVAEAVAKMLPGVVDKATPEGKTKAA